MTKKVQRHLKGPGHSIPGAASELGWSESVLRGGCKRGEVNYVEFNGLWRIPDQEIDRLRVLFGQTQSGIGTRIIRPCGTVRLSGRRLAAAPPHTMNMKRSTAITTPNGFVTSSGMGRKSIGTARCSAAVSITGVISVAMPSATD